jgi:hypothetical protein
MPGWGRGYVKAYQEYFYDESTGMHPVTLAAVELEPMRGLKEPLRKLATELISAATDNKTAKAIHSAQALRNNKLVNAELTKTITTGKVSPPRFSGNAKYAYGFGDKNSGGDRVVGHTGGAPGMNAQLDIHWNTGYTVVVLANLDPPAATEWAKYISDRLPVDAEKAGGQIK